MNAKQQGTTFDQDLEPYVIEGRKCELWGCKATDMVGRQLLGFVGYLDMCLTIELRARKKRELDEQQSKR